MCQALQGDVQRGRGFLTAMREKTERAATFLEEPEAEQMREEVSARLSQQEELVGSIRQELSTLDKSLQLSKDFLDKYKAQAQWVSETRALLGAPLEPKAELYQRKAQLAKYKVSAVEPSDISTSLLNSGLPNGTVLYSCEVLFFCAPRATCDY